MLDELLSPKVGHEVLVQSHARHHREDAGFWSRMVDNCTTVAGRVDPLWNVVLQTLQFEIRPQKASVVMSKPLLDKNSGAAACVHHAHSSKGIDTVRPSWRHFSIFSPLSVEVSTAS